MSILVIEGDLTINKYMIMFLTVVGVAGDPVLVVQELSDSVSQMDGDTGVYSGQLCWGSRELLVTVMPLKTNTENNSDITYTDIANILLLKSLIFNANGFLHTSREVERVVWSKSRESISLVKTGAAGGVYWAPQSRAKR